MNFACSVALASDPWEFLSILSQVARSSLNSAAGQGEADGCDFDVEGIECHWASPKRVQASLVLSQCRFAVASRRRSHSQKRQICSHNDLCAKRIRELNITHAISESSSITTRFCPSCADEDVPLGEWWSQLTSTPCIPSITESLCIVKMCSTAENQKGGRCTSGQSMAICGVRSAAL